MICEFCGKEAVILCDGILYGKKTCDRKMCRTCAGDAIDLTADAMFRCSTRDLCPWCRRSGRKAQPVLDAQKARFAQNRMRT
jgi:hypothetical protein